MGTVEPMSRAGVALDLILKTLIQSQDFNNIQSKNWEAISKLVPGTTAGMVRCQIKLWMKQVGKSNVFLICEKKTPVIL